MRRVILIIFLVSPLVTSAIESSQTFSWQTFKSDQGFELKVPNCWKASVDDPDEKGPVSAAENIAFNEVSGCIRPKHNLYMPNGICVGPYLKYKTPQSRIKEIDDLEGYMKRQLAEKENIVVQRYKSESDEVIAYVRYMSDRTDIQWRAVVFCPERAFEIVIMTLKDPSSEYFKRFKDGKLGLPDPERTALESFKCVDAKPTSNNQKKAPAKSKTK